MVVTEMSVAKGKRTIGTFGESIEYQKPNPERAGSHAYYEEVLQWPKS
jgi:hypothetical protein